MITVEQRQAYEETGIVHVRGAFSRTDAEEIVGRVWAILKAKSDVRREDPASWNIVMGYGFGDLKTDPAFRKVGSPTTVSAIDCLLGQDGWVRPSNWGQLLVTFPEADKTGTVPTEIGTRILDFFHPLIHLVS